MRSFFFLVFFSSLIGSLFAESGSYTMTYYSDAFEWKRTSFWEVFRQDGFSSAFCGVPLWSLVYVQMGSSGMTLKVNDRPNCQKHDDLIDVSKAVFTRFAPLSRGKVVWVSVTPLWSAPIGYEKRLLEANTFENDGITLDPDLPNTYCVNESIVLRGKTLSNNPSVTVLLLGNNGSEWVSSVFVGKNRDFVLPIPPQAASWKYLLSLANSTTVTNERTTPLWVLDCTWIETLSLPNVTLGNVFPRFLSSEIAWYSRIRLWNDMYRVSLIQWEKRIDVRGKGEVILPNIWLESGTATVSISATPLTTPFSLDRNGAWSTVYERSILLVPSYPSLLPPWARVFTLWRNGNIRFRSPWSQQLQGQYFVTLPDGSVRSYAIPSQFLDRDGNVLSGTLLSLRFPLEMEGVYLVEVPDISGKAWMNVPLIYGKGVWPILPSPLESASKRILSAWETVRKNQYARINDFRREQELPLLTVDPVLERIAQEKAEDMLLHGYVGHRDFQWRMVSDVASSFSDTLASDLIGENVAGGNQSDSILFEWLKLSGWHRYNMLFPEWKKIGVGYATGDWQVYLVQVFGN